MLTLETMKTLYFDCFSGISGDMTIAALLDLGLDFDYLKTELQKLPVEGYELKVSRVTRSNAQRNRSSTSLLEENPRAVITITTHPHHHDIIIFIERLRRFCR